MPRPHREIGLGRGGGGGGGGGEIGVFSFSCQELSCLVE